MQIALDLKKLYDEDEHLWLIENAKVLREGHVDLADIEHIAETLEEMGKRDLREIFSRLRVLYSHLLKWIYQKDRRSNSWKGTIVEQRKELKRSFQDARDVASAETGLSLSTFPEEPPFTFEESLDEEYLP